jgi:hypothetical protein
VVVHIWAVVVPSLKTSQQQICTVDIHPPPFRWLMSAHCYLPGYLHMLTLIGRAHMIDEQRGAYPITKYLGSQLCILDKDREVTVGLLKMLVQKPLQSRED